MSQYETSHEKDSNIKGVSIDRVVNKAFLKQLNEMSYKCNICYNVIINPHDCTQCHFAYCFNCIGFTQCPNKCTDSKIKPSSRGIKMLISKLIFSCSFEQCSEKIPYNDLLNHEKECGFQKRKCPNIECNQLILKKDIEDHIKIKCLFSYIKCQFCNNSFKRDDIQYHIKSCDKAVEIISDNDNNEDNTNKSIPKFYKKLVKSQHFENFTVNVDKILQENDIKYNQLESNISVMNHDISANINKILSDYQYHSKNHSSLPERTNKIENPSLKEILDKINNNIVKCINQKIALIIKKKVTIISKNDNKMSPCSVEFDIYFKEFLEKILSHLSTLKVQIINQTMSLFYDTVVNKVSSKGNSKNINEGSKIITDIIDAMDRNYNLINDEINDNERKNELKRESTENVKTLLDKFMTNAQENITEIIEDKMKEIEEYILKLQSYLSQNNEIFYSSLIDELDSMNTELNWVNKNYKDMSSIITEEFEELKNNLDNFEVENLRKILNQINYSKTNGNHSSSDINEAISNNICKDDIILILSNLGGKDIINNIVKSIDLSSLIENDLMKNKSKYRNGEKTLKQMYEGTNRLKNSLINFPNVLNEENTNYNLPMTNLYSVEPSPRLYKNDQDDELINDKLGNVKKNLNIFLENSLENVSIKYEESITKDLSSMNELKWCNQCNQLDYCFGFINCKLCSNDNCKNCVSLCQSCDTINCKYCLKCPNCENLYCEKCRKSCLYCEKKDKFCEDCIYQCLYCKKEICLDCSKKCMKCKSTICSLCSKFCKVCKKCECSRCEESQNFTSCFFCKSRACNECSLPCSSCYLDTCLNCNFKCGGCSKVLCKRCKMDCFNCESIFCKDCAKVSLNVNCNFCSKNICVLCLKNVKRCKGCNLTFCRNCCSVCKKCKVLYCNNCNINCDNCSDYTCSACIYKCVCDNIVFCEGCLFGSNAIGPHECLYFLNEAPSFSGIKTRSKYSLPKNFEAKIFLENFESSSLLIGVTDNSDFVVDSLTYIDNIWCYKVKTGEKYSSKGGLEKLSDKKVSVKDSIIIAVKNNQLFFRVNYDQAESAYNLDPNRNYYLYIENETPHAITKVVFVYIRKI